MSETVQEQKVEEETKEEQAETAESASKTEEAKTEEAKQEEAKTGEAEAKGEQPREEREEVKEKPKFKVERDYVVPLRKVYWLGRNRRAKRAVRVLRQFVLRHTKAEHVVIDNEVNEAIWARSIKRPPRRLAVHVGVTEDKKAYVYLQKKSSD